MNPLILTFLAVLVVVVLRTSKRRPPLPPGPNGLPIVGPLLSIATRKENLVAFYDNWSKIYGDVYHFSIFGHRTVVLGSTRAVFDLLDKRSSNYSDRPDMPMVRDLMGWNWNFSVMRYSDWWRIHRRTFHQYFQPRVMPDYYPVLETTSSQLMKNLMESPDNFNKHIKFASDSAILQVIYGYTLKETGDPYIALVEKVGRAIGESGNHGSFWVDYFPSMKHVPSWFPGAGFKRKAKLWAEQTRDFVESPWEWLTASIARIPPSQQGPD